MSHASGLRAFWHAGPSPTTPSPHTTLHWTGPHVSPGTTPQSTQPGPFVSHSSPAATTPSPHTAAASFDGSTTSCVQHGSARSAAAAAIAMSRFRIEPRDLNPTGMLRATTVSWYSPAVALTPEAAERAAEGAPWEPPTGGEPKKRRLPSLYVQVLFAIAVGVFLGWLRPDLGVQMKPFGDGFVKLIKMLIAPIVFTT